MKRFIILTSALSTLILSCTKIITPKIKSSDARLIIEGNLSTVAEKHVVKVSKTIQLNQNTAFNGVSNALIIITDNQGYVDTLKEKNAGIYETKVIAGIIGHTYDITVTVDNKKYIAQSTIPTLVAIDSIVIVPNSFPADTNKEIQVVLTDIANQKNYYRMLKIDSVNAINYTSFSDKGFDGLQGNVPYETDSTSHGKTFFFELQCTDAALDLYYRSLRQNQNSGSTPANPVSNFSGGCLGYFSAHTKSVKSIFLP
jgi:Domain of unknown function (DUF4249)